MHFVLLVLFFFSQSELSAQEVKSAPYFPTSFWDSNHINERLFQLNDEHGLPDWSIMPPIDDQAASQYAICGGFFDPPDFPEEQSASGSIDIRTGSLLLKSKNDLELKKSQIAYKTNFITLKSALYNFSSKRLSINAPFILRRPDLLLWGEEGQISFETKLFNARNTSFLLHEKGYWGKARHIEQAEKDDFTLNNVELTSCPPAQPIWKVTASKVDIDRQEETLNLKSAKVTARGIPIFYTPYLQISLSDERRTGLLWPLFASSKEYGVALSTPYYFNLAPHYDMTFFPILLSNQGVGLEVEARHASTSIGATTASVSLINTFLEDLIDKEDPELTPNSWLITLNHVFRNRNNHIEIEYGQVSLPSYFEQHHTFLPIEPLYGEFLNQSLSWNYLIPNAQFYFNLTSFESLNLDLGAYRKLPEIGAKVLYPLGNVLDFDLDTHLAHFRYFSDSESSLPPTATRAYFSPKLFTSLTNFLPLYGSASLQWFYTAYDIEEGDDSLVDNMPRSSYLEMRGSVSKSWYNELLFGENTFQHIFRPEFQWLNVDILDQSYLSELPLLDTQKTRFFLMDDIFSTQHLGIERIIEKNQFAFWAHNTFYLSGNSSNIVKASLASVTHLSEASANNSFGSLLLSEEEGGFESLEQWLLLIRWDYNQRHLLKYNIAWEAEGHSLLAAQAHWRYMFSQMAFNLKYDHVSRPDDLEPWRFIGFALDGNLTHHLRLNAGLGYNVDTQTFNEQTVTLEYLTCCLNIALEYQRSTRYNFRNETYTPTRFLLKLSLPD